MRCLLCGSVKRRLVCHHGTARGPDGGYLDPAFVVGLCRACHDTEVHARLRRLRLDAPGDVGPGAAGVAAIRLHRSALLVALVAARDDLPSEVAAFLDLLADAQVGWARELGRSA